MPYPYTIETLQRYDVNRSHSLFQFDVEKANRLCKATAALRTDDPVPVDGDRIICISTIEGQVSDRGYLERRDGLLTVCTQPSSVHMDEFDDGRIYTTAGGGPWTGYMSEERFLTQAEYLGKATAAFWTWGRWGSGANKGIYFEAEVSLWRFTSERGF